MRTRVLLVLEKADIAELRAAKNVKEEHMAAAVGSWLEITLDKAKIKFNGVKGDTLKEEALEAYAMIAPREWDYCRFICNKQGDLRNQVKCSLCQSRVCPECVPDGSQLRGFFPVCSKSERMHSKRKKKKRECHPRNLLKVIKTGMLELKISTYRSGRHRTRGTEETR